MTKMTTSLKVGGGGTQGLPPKLKKAPARLL